ncbi:FAD-dependent oxidoreductase [Streptomyces sp. NBC_00503]|uniref:FAD-dependent oxidoreductase n=1 Tax=Streptomyces sp. NBC_00503 TaxID=2903659 RepID=UPI002E822135|nr:FAD-dependent oxidoreductase [Streptomyces sp. NBC_00503]WUD86572.1 FAD-dependent oxidoreductase [Streptomyces sp. NBC_00503]
MRTFAAAPSEPGKERVLVVGAGPVGLTAAHELARRGLRVRVVDAAPGPARTSRAVAVHPRTLETFDQMGIVDGVLAEGRRNAAFTMYAGGRRLVRLEADYESMPTRFPYTVVIGQTRTEGLLREAVGRLGVTVEWGVRLTGLEQDRDGVRASLEHPDGSVEEYEVPWLVGCDGGHSTVRKQLKLPLIGESSETWELADASVEMDLAPDTIYWVHTGGQALMMVPYREDGRWRLLDTAPVRRPGDPAGSGAEVSRRFSEKLSAGLGRPVHVGEPEWTSVFTFQQRMVPRMDEGRCFVAGDAAHVHSPASGQGMNTGVQEAYNLAWKLAMVDRGQAGAELLATYGQERVPVGKALLGSTRKATFLVQFKLHRFKDALAGLALPVVFTVVRNVRPLRRAIQRKVLGGMSGLRLAYPESPLTTPGEGTGLPAGSRAAAAAALHPDDPGSTELRAELRDTRWSLVWAQAGPGEASIVAASAAASYGRWLSVRTVGDGEGGPGPLADPSGQLRRSLGLEPCGWLLIRPDGYVAAGGSGLTRLGLERALAPLGLLAEVRHIRGARGSVPALPRISDASAQLTGESEPRRA